MRSVVVLLTFAAFCLNASAGFGANLWGLKSGNPELKSAGALAFGPDGILLVGDAKAATVFAIQTEDSDSPIKGDLSIDNLEKKIAETVGSDSVKVNDLAVNPENGNAYISVSKGENGAPALLQVNGKGEVSEMKLAGVPFAKAELSNAPEDKVVRRGRRSSNPRNDSITDLAYNEGKVFVSGLRNDEDASSVRGLVFPFADTNSETSVEIYHGAHGRYETRSAIRTFIPFNIEGEPHLLAGFVCTPLVKFPVKSLGSDRLRATTVAELGNRNRPLDMVVYKQDGKDFVLMANDRRGVMKISTDDISRNEGITERVGGGGTAGQTYETIDDLEGVVQLAKLSDQYAVVIVKDGESHQLKSVVMP